jgi:hypothetical protein
MSKEVFKKISCMLAGFQHNNLHYSDKVAKKNFTTLVLELAVEYQDVLPMLA